MEYKVVETGTSATGLEKVLNQYAKEGWVVKTITRTPGSECSFTVVLEK